MIEKENFPMEDNELPGQDDQNLNDVNSMSIEEQEQRNDEDLVQRLEEENDPLNDDYDDKEEVIDEPSPGEEELNDYTERELPGGEGYAPAGDDRPVSKNLLGDNPPGSEQKAFDSGNTGDMTKDQAKYPADNLRENFRENLDKASAEINLDKKLKEDQ
ncbi:hypothetical protein BDE36_2981 [Arcticibacter tournemirensis]|uniref:Uncharacterized protein n=1 Tax=Arcticibacter tournemirensis TaxID=699437 RepID=A0A5M9GTR4_9SPHI|nr:hypothetical protein [Arcticibacter tournemirensis]KAA8477145.1 hypothetical protein F1649_19095 [Arcticibacter tournemirensis]TQM51209.1 hypothetical protein BDE36_2981 [Arcticibacter tournemirensis]